MLVQEIVHTDIAPLKSSDHISLAIAKMDLLHVEQLAVVDKEGILKGMANINVYAELDEEVGIVDDYPLSESIFIPSYQHVFEAARLMLAHELFVLPVLDHENKLVGMVRKQDVLEALGDMFNLSSYGSVLTIEQNHHDFTLSDLVRIIETEGAKILGIAVQQPTSDYPNYRISVKLNLEDSSVVSAALRRFGYLITSEAQSELLVEDFSERADELFRYLDI
ncbi:MAG: CBS domain-containing protein [Bacteroidota bacterium]